MTQLCVVCVYVCRCAHMPSLACWHVYVYMCLYMYVKRDKDGRREIGEGGESRRGGSERERERLGEFEL